MMGRLKHAINLNGFVEESVETVTVPKGTLVKVCFLFGEYQVSIGSLWLWLPDDGSIDEIVDLLCTDD